MEIDFKSVKKAVLLDPDKRKKYYASLKGDISSDEIIEHVAIMSEMSNKEMYELLWCFGKAVAKTCKDGDIINISSTTAFRVGIDGEGDKRVLHLYFIDPNTET